MLYIVKGGIIMIGDIIRQARQNQKLSQSELAKLIGMTQAGISKLELGECDPSAKTMMKIADVLGIQNKLFPTTNIDEIDMDLEKRIERRVEARLEARLEERLEERLKENLRKEIQLEFNKKFDPILQILTRNLSCETCNGK